MQTNNKLREAAKEISRITHIYRIVETAADMGSDLAKIRKIVDAALSAPALNCEVGTVEEQSERFHAYCEAHKDNDAECLYCPLFGQTGGHCELAWAQMPYEEKEGGAK